MWWSQRGAYSSPSVIVSASLLSASSHGPPSPASAWRDATRGSEAPGSAAAASPPRADELAAPLVRVRVRGRGRVRVRVTVRVGTAALGRAWCYPYPYPYPLTTTPTPTPTPTPYQESAALSRVQKVLAGDTLTPPLL